MLFVRIEGMIRFEKIYDLFFYFDFVCLNLKIKLIYYYVFRLRVYRVLYLFMFIYFDKNEYSFYNYICIFICVFMNCGIYKCYG